MICDAIKISCYVQLSRKQAQVKTGSQQHNKNELEISIRKIEYDIIRNFFQNLTYNDCLHLKATNDHWKKNFFLPSSLIIAMSYTGELKFTWRYMLMYLLRKS